ncbi:MAG: hypothetical protein IIB42_07365 [Candidatus Marinimicrobia bacterium]|nr:hypothetical protein [Candidatus Neomarinimicrobiota bacterium]
MLQNMGWGIGLYGWGLPFVLDVDDFKWYVGGEMFSLGASLYLTWKYTQGINLPEARSQMQRYGGVVGFHYGVALNRLLETEDRLPVMVLMAAVPAGTWAGDRLYRHWRPSTGQAYALALHAELGRSVLSLVHRQIDARPQEPQFGDDTASERDLSWQKINTVLQVAGYPLGTYLGHRLYGNRQYSFGDAALLIVGRGAGALYGFLLTDLLDFDFDEDNMGWRWLVMAGGLGGVAGMDRYMRSYDFTFGQAAMLTLGGVAGAAFAAGFGVILEIDEVKYYELAAIGGSLGGLVLTRRIVNPRLESSRAQGPETGPQLNLALQPMLVGGNFRPGLDLELRW